MFCTQYSHDTHQCQSRSSYQIVVDSLVGIDICRIHTNFDSCVHRHLESLCIHQYLKKFTLSVSHIFSCFFVSSFELLHLRKVIFSKGNIKVCYTFTPSSIIFKSLLADASIGSFWILTLRVYSTEKSSV